MKCLKHVFGAMILSTGLMCAEAQQTAKVVRVWDGDSYNLLVSGKVISARLVNVDAPEMNQPWGKESKQLVEGLMLGKDVIFQSNGLDKYRRTLAQLWVNGVRLDSLMVRNGWAWHYVSYSKDKGLAQLQDEAIAAKRGMWECGVVGVCPPWLYRGYDRVNRIKYCTGCKK